MTSSDTATVLVIEDHVATAEAVQEKVASVGFHVVVAHTAAAGLAAFREQNPDVIVLDIMLPDGDGRDLCRTIRQSSRVPIIMLTAKVDEVDRIVGLEVGADDYVIKPFSAKELLARIRAVMRRSRGVQKEVETTYRAAGIELNEARREVRVDGEPVHLTPIQYNLLWVLMRHAGELVSRRTLIETLWDKKTHSSNLLEVHIGKLRRKIEQDPRKPQRLVTVRTFGYKIAADPTGGR